MSYTCIRKCYHHNTLFRVGEKLPPGVKPNKHFHKDGEEFTQEAPILAACDDSRTAEEIALDIESRGEKVPAKIRKSHKKVFALWVEVKDLPIKDAKRETKQKKPTKIVEDVKPISSLSPDALDALKPKEIGEMYGIAWQGKSKATLIEEALEKEKG